MAERPRREKGLEIEYECHAMGYLLPRELFFVHPEYFREDKTTVMELKSVGATLFDFNQKIKDNYLNKYLNEVNGSKPYSFQRGIVAFFPLGFFSVDEDRQLGQHFSDVEVAHKN